MIIAFWLHSLLLLVVAGLFWKFPPQTINSIYGYRTAASMKDDSSWKKANHYSSKLLLIMACGLLVFQLIISNLLGVNEKSVLVSTIFIVILLPFLIVFTERHLKK